MARYYSMLVDRATGNAPLSPGEPDGGTYDDAAKRIADFEAAKRTRIRVGPDGEPVVDSEPGAYVHRILLDVGSVDVTDPTELPRLLRTDPLLHLVYELGRERGARMLAEHIGTEIPPADPQTPGAHLARILAEADAADLAADPNWRSLFEGRHTPPEGPAGSTEGAT